jgi:hypothetical protein
MSVAPRFGASALLRVGGLPLAAWLAAGRPQLFEQLDALDRRDAQLAQLAGRLERLLDAELVAPPDVPREVRAAALTLRRALHAGRAPRERDWQAAERALAGGSPSAQLVDSFRRTREAARAAADARARAEAALAAEQARLRRDPWALAQRSPLAYALFRGANPGVIDDVERRLRDGASWDEARLPRRSDYLWRLVARAATKSTPRDLMGAVALVRVGRAARNDVLSLRDEVAVQWTTNVHGRPAANGDDDVRLSLQPLRWREGDRLAMWVVDHDDPSRLVEITLAATELLLAVCDRAGRAPVTLAQLADGVGGPAARETVAGFAEHLASLGVLQASGPPSATTLDWGAASRALALRRAPHAGHGFLDVYRRSGDALPAGRVAALEQLLGLALRMRALVAAEREASAPPQDEDVSERPRALIDVLRGRLEAPPAPPARRLTDWPPPLDPDSGYARLLGAIEQLIDGADPERPIDVSPALLDRAGAPPAELDWPLDCLLRVPRGGAPYEAVLDQILPAGLIDARFAATLAGLHGDVEHLRAYRAFLRAVERDAGIRFVELLIPPLSPRAANAVRRPLLVDAWTGDPDPRPYQLGGRPRRFVALQDIALRRAGGELVAEAGGERIWPVYHATRTPLAPWNVLADALLGAAPQTARQRTRRFALPPALLGQRAFLPRITLGGRLVISCAQWHVDAGELWSAGDAELRKARALAALRRERRLPRWVYAAPRAGKPIACDLASVRTIPALERLLASERDLIFTEMLPAPDELLVRHGSDAFVSELVLRLPVGEPVERLAARTVASLLGRRDGGLRRDRSPPAPAPPVAARQSERTPAGAGARR